MDNLAKINPAGLGDFIKSSELLGCDVFLAKGLELLKMYLTVPDSPFAFGKCGWRADPTYFTLLEQAIEGNKISQSLIRNYVTMQGGDVDYLNSHF